MSIDDYTGVSGGGAVSQFHRKLGDLWILNDRTFDGCIMKQVLTSETADLITLTICGNDALMIQDDIVNIGVDKLLGEHLNLLKALRETNPNACLVVGNIYSPQIPFSDAVHQRLIELNDGIKQNISQVNGYLADIFAAFEGNENEYLCFDIEPSFTGATVIADLFEEQFLKAK